MGTLSDKGAQALYLSEKVRALKHLNLEHHFMSDEMMSYFTGTATAEKVKKAKTKKGFLGLGKKDSEGTAAPESVLNLPVIPAGQFGPTVNLNDQQEEEDDYRYVAAGE